GRVMIAPALVRGRTSVLVATGVAAVTLLAFLPALGGQFVDFDDLYNFVLNSRYRGLGPGQLAWMLGLPPTHHFWGPLAWLTLGVDWLLWGGNAWGYHLTNLVLHAATAAAFVLLAERLLARAVPGVSPAVRRAGAATAALFWALHPLRVESVAWISERRDVLSGVLIVLTLLAWLRAVDAAAPARRRWLAAAVAAYALSMLAKPIGMTLPLVLLVLDVYPLRRLSLDRRALAGREARAALADVLPFAAVALVGGALALALTHEVKSLAAYPLWVRPALLGHVLTFSLEKTAVPLGLVPLYEIPARWTLADHRLVLGPLIAGGVTVIVAILARCRWPAPAAAWAVYVIVIAPVGGVLIHGGPQLTADRYTYLPTMALALLLGGGVCVLARAVREGALDAGSARLAAGGLLLWLAGLGVLTWQQSEVWGDSITLWDHAATFSPDCARCLHGLGLAWQHGGAPQLAVGPLSRAVTLRPDLGFETDLGVALWASGRSAEAVPYLQTALARQPRSGALERQLGAALIDAGRPEEARAHFAAVLGRRPEDVDALVGLGLALVALGRPGDSLPALERATALSPRAAPPRYALVRAYRALGDDAGVDREVAVLRDLDPRLAERAARR
ncbi:MAG TPA: tetratricopeptide repeat protein, partial [Methylomirabilota bacterium]|nr:tetratricopeptide repeat protein [Methylomirabilota bacterium]